MALDARPKIKRMKLIGKQKGPMTLFSGCTQACCTPSNSAEARCNDSLSLLFRTLDRKIEPKINLTSRTPGEGLLSLPKATPDRSRPTKDRRATQEECLPVKGSEARKRQRPPVPHFRTL